MLMAKKGRWGWRGGEVHMLDPKASSARPQAGTWRQGLLTRGSLSLSRGLTACSAWPLPAAVPGVTHGEIPEDL